MLLVKDTYGPGLWLLPGGMAELGESAQQAARREVAEETGLDVSITGLLGVADQLPVVLFFFAGNIEGGELEPRTDEIADFGWFTPSEIEGLGLDETIGWVRDLCGRCLQSSTDEVPSPITVDTRHETHDAFLFR